MNLLGASTSHGENCVTGCPGSIAVKLAASMRRHSSAALLFLGGAEPSRIYC